jgi:hypothetical protein
MWGPSNAGCAPLVQTALLLENGFLSTYVHSNRASPMLKHPSGFFVEGVPHCDKVVSSLVY